MATSMTNWLGPLLEHELKEATEWKQRTHQHRYRSKPTGTHAQAQVDNAPVRAFSDRDFSNIFIDDGSSLFIRSHVPRDRARVVQILDISRNLKCRLSDGYTSIKARLTPDAEKSLREEDERDASTLQRGILLSIPEFQIRATTLGKLDERLQLHISHARVFNSMRNGTFGTPKDINESTKIKKAMSVLQTISHDSGDDRALPCRNGTGMGSQALPRDATQGTQFTSGDSQSFATQAVAAARRPNRPQGALNLAAPVPPSRTASGLGSQAAMNKGKDGFRNPLGLLQGMHGFGERPQKDEACAPSGRAFLHSNGNDNARSAPASMSRDAVPHIRRRHLGAIDLTDEDVATEEIEEDAVEETAFNMGADQSREVDDHEDVAEDAGDLPVKDNDDQMHGQRDDNSEEEAGLEQQAEAEADVEQLVLRESPPYIKPEPQSPERASSPIQTRQDSPAQPIRRQDSSDNAAAVPWHGITRLKRSLCVVPDDQEKLLSRKESWNPPAPGTQYPMPNIPRHLLEQIEGRLLAQAQKGKETVELPSLRPTSRDDQSSRGLESSRSPPASSPEQMLPWGSSPTRTQREELPPDSSGLLPQRERIRVAHQDNEEDVLMEDAFPPDSPDHDEMFGPRQAPRSRTASRPTSAHQSGNPSPRTSNFFPSDVDPSILHYSRNDEPLLLQPSTLSQSHFRSPAKEKAVSGASPMGPPGRRRTSDGSPRTYGSTYHPGFQSAQVPETPRFLDGHRSSNPPMSRVPTSEADRQAEEQLQQEFRLSTEKTSKMRSPSDRPEHNSSPIGRAERAVNDAATPPQVLGKRVPSSPASANDRPRKSLFGFSQEEPVSQDPAILARNMRREFLKSKKQHHDREDSKSVEPQRPQPNLGSPFSTAELDRQLNESMPDPDLGISSSPPQQPSKKAPNEQIDRETRVESHVEEPQRPVRLPESPGKQNEPPARARPHEQDELRAHGAPTRTTFDSLYQDFCAAYEDYKGNIKHFTNLLNDIDRTQSRLHQFLWDDYVVRNKTDYLPYSMECLESGERSMPYEIFYSKKITKPKYTEGVLSAEKLEPLFDGASQSQRPRSSHRSPPPRFRDREPDHRSPHQSRTTDRYVPAPRASMAPSPAPSTAVPPQSTRPKNKLLMMTIDSPPRKKRPEQPRTAPPSNERQPPKGPKAEQVPKPTAPPASTADPQARRSLPWGAGDRHARPSVAPGNRVSSASDGRRSSNKGRKF